LSWKLPCDLYIKTGLSVNLNDATNNPATADTLGPGVFATAGNGYYWVSPTLGLSWLHDGWNISVFSNYAFPFEDSGTGYHSGQQLAIDYTVTKTFGKWTFGVGASEETQITTDSVHGTNIPDSKANLWSIGPVVGYNFGPCSLMFTYGFPVYTNNDLAGEWFNVRFVVPLGM
jgi:hypothetical protein